MNQAKKRRNPTLDSNVNPKVSTSGGGGGSYSNVKANGYPVTLLKIVGVLSFINLLLALLYLQQKYYPSPKLLYKINSTIEIKELNEGENLETILKKATQPILLKNSVVTQWKAMHKWTPDYLSQNIGVIKNVYRNTNRVFGPYYDNTKPLTPIVSRRNQYEDNVTMNSNVLLQTISGDVTRDKYLYFTGDVESIGDWILDDLHPLGDLILFNSNHASLNIWIGQAGVIAHMHYDGYHNLYAQIKGRKRFTLFPPSSWPHLYPYPFLHPHHAQSQVNLSYPFEYEKFPFIRDATAIEVTLVPGNLLYIPPLWWHYVKAIDTSVSVNGWSDSEQTQIVQQLFDLKLQLHGENAGQSRKDAILMCLVIRQVLKVACDVKNCRGVIEEGLWKKKDIINQVVLKDLPTYQLYKLVKIRYHLTNEELNISLLGSDVWKDGFTGLLCEGSDMYENMIKNASNMLENNEYYFKRVQTLVARLPNDTWELWLGNYIEYLAYTVVPIKEVARFLTHSISCLELAYVINAV